MKHKFYIFFLFIGISSLSFGQVPTKIDSAENNILEIAEQFPTFPGGESALYQFLSQNFKYPEIARQKGLQGRFIVEFAVRKTGKITDVKIVKGAIGGGCEEEVLRVFKNMPNWIPGKQKGETVNVRFRMPFVLKLNEDKTKEKGKTKKEIRQEKRKLKVTTRNGLD